MLDFIVLNFYNSLAYMKLMVWSPMAVYLFMLWMSNHVTHKALGWSLSLHIESICAEYYQK